MNNDITFKKIPGAGVNYWTTVEIDHSLMPVHGDDEGLLNWARSIRAALASRQSEKLPQGVKRIGERNE